MFSAVVKSGLHLCKTSFVFLLIRAVVPNLFEFGEHLQIKNKSWEHYDGQTNFWEHLLVSSWEQFEENSRHLGIFGSTWWKFRELFWSREHWLGNTGLEVAYILVKKQPENGLKILWSKFSAPDYFSGQLFFILGVS